MVELDPDVPRQRSGQANALVEVVRACLRGRGTAGPLAAEELAAVEHDGQVRVIDLLDEPQHVGPGGAVGAVVVVLEPDRQPDHRGLDTDLPDRGDRAGPARGPVRLGARPGKYPQHGRPRNAAAAIASRALASSPAWRIGVDAEVGADRELRERQPLVEQRPAHPGQRRRPQVRQVAPCRLAPSSPCSRQIARKSSIVIAPEAIGRE